MYAIAAHFNSNHEVLPIDEQHLSYKLHLATSKKKAFMTDFNRSKLPDSVRSNGATPNPWWANAVVYQIYPRSFQDSNGDGIGDLKGITSRLDYLADLGVDVLWLSPVFKSPQDDNGYDISDYQDIDPLFGTMADMDELLAEAHKRGLKVIMDLVVNHTSDEHAWFQASRDKDDPHADWYWWRPARPGHEPGTPGAEPNQWGSYFGGSAWEYDPKRGEYYFHQFSKKQPDLNWENPEVRKAVYKMMNWWMDRGTPYIYEGEELGMTNAHFTELDQYRDLESLNAYRQRVIETEVQDSESMMHGIAERSRDNARTPMQWDGSKYAGFTAPDAATEPWISVNPNHVEINAAAQCDDPESVHAFYKQLIDLRHRNPVVAAGDFRLLDASDRQVYSFVRALSSKDGQVAKRLLVMVNVSGEIARIPSETAALLPLDVDESHIVITTHDSAHTKLSLTKRELAPWEGVAIEL